MRSVTKHLIAKIVLVLVSVLAGLMLTEIGLRVSDKVRGMGDLAIKAEPDPVLGWRIAPHAYGHDANGFRNDGVPAHADVVALGDSQTWGVNVSRSEAWPQVLGKMSGRTVYNMSLGSYGPAQYWALTDKAMQLSPDTIVIGLYFGNDFYNAYSLVYDKEAYAFLRDSGKTDKLLPDTVATEAQALRDEERTFLSEYGSSGPGWNYWLLVHTAIGRLLTQSGVITDPWYEISKAWAQAHPDHGAVYEDQQSRTVFTTAYRLTGLNLDEPRIAEGMRLTKDFLERTKSRTDQKSIRLLVLTIPTKEMVYAEAMQKSQGQLESNYARLVEMETRARAEVISFCEQKGIRYADALPGLRAAVQQNKQIYPTYSEGHPNAQGYAVMASTVNDALGRLGEK